MKITKADFDRAVAQPWDTVTCLLAQTVIRNGGTPEDDLTPKFGDVVLAKHLMEIFDVSSWSIESTSDGHRLSKHEALTGLCLLRAMLPMDV